MPSYSKEDFTMFLDEATGDQWVPTSLFVRLIGCEMQTANRHLLELARQGVVEVYDPKVGDGEQVPVDEIEETTGRLLGFRYPPDDPDTAPNYLQTAAKRL